MLRELIGHGHEVVNADRRPPGAAGLGPYREVDLANVGHVAGALSGCDAVVHLGAIPTANSPPDEVVFGNNTRATFAVLQAAALLGIRRAVLASSLAALGGAYAATPFPPLYAPVDEHHPLQVEDPYGLSKEVDERIGSMFHRRTGMTVLAYRFHWIAQPDEYVARAIQVRERPERWRTICGATWMSATPPMRAGSVSSRRDWGSRYSTSPPPTRSVRCPRRS